MLRGIEICNKIYFHFCPVIKLKTAKFFKQLPIFTSTFNHIYYIINYYFVSKNKKIAAYLLFYCFLTLTRTFT